MSRANRMREKRASVSVYLIKLIKIYASDRDSLICVFEGEDSKYYGSRVDFITTIGRKNINCRGKNNVVALRKKVELNSELKDANVIYFVDKDFDEIKTEDSLYVTPCYSIENLYTTPSVLSRILIDEFLLDSIENSDDIKCILEKYKRVSKEFNSCLLPLNSWLKIQVENYEKDSKVRLNIDNVSLSKLVDVTLDTVIAKYSIESISDLFPECSNISQEVVDSAVAIFSDKNLTMFSRGKYRLEFFRQWVSKLILDARTENPELFSNKIKIKLSLSKNNILSELSQYADTPNCLNKFITCSSSR